jgi:hypothetical protein
MVIYSCELCEQLLPQWNHSIRIFNVKIHPLPYLKRSITPFGSWKGQVNFKLLVIVLIGDRIALDFFIAEQLETAITNLWYYILMSQAKESQNTKS